VQGYNSLPGAEPLNRSELYRQTFLEDRFIFRIGKLVPTYDFNNVARPVPTHDKELEIPAVTGLLYTPIYVNPTLLAPSAADLPAHCALLRRIPMIEPQGAH
jgi:porin